MTLTNIIFCVYKFVFVFKEFQRLYSDFVFTFINLIIYLLSNDVIKYIKKINPLDLIGFEINLKNLFNGAEQCSSYSTTSMNNKFKKKRKKQIS